MKLNKINKYLKRIISAAFCIMCIFLFAGCIKTDSRGPITGVWWWSKNLDAETYLNYCLKNNVTEIYYCDTKLNDNTKSFLEKCHEKNIDVYMLDGDYRWLTDENKKQKLFEKLDNFVNFQNNNQIKFSGVHLDIEPHQAPNFKDNKKSLILNLIELVNELKQKYTDVKFDYDIPFWFDDEIMFNNTIKPAYAHIIDAANKVTIMSYRDSAKKIYDVASDEIEYAKGINKTLNLSVETSDVKENIVSFYEEGKDFLNTELEKLRQMLPENFGISIHHIKSWYELN